MQETKGDNMNVEIIGQLTAGELLTYFAGGILIMSLPPIVGLMAVRTIFGAPAQDAREVGRRAMGAIGISLSIAFALGATGVSLLAPASADIFIILIILCLIFGLLGAGKLYWEDE